MKLNGHRSIATVVITKNSITLISKGVPTCIINNGTWLQCLNIGDSTTKRHITWFLQEYAPVAPTFIGEYQMQYADAKTAYKFGHMINCMTGEVFRWDN